MSQVGLNRTSLFRIFVFSCPLRAYYTENPSPQDTFCYNFLAYGGDRPRPPFLFPQPSLHRPDTAKADTVMKRTRPTAIFALILSSCLARQPMVGELTGEGRHLSPARGANVHNNSFRPTKKYSIKVVSAVYL